MIEFKPANISEKYLIEWNERSRDIVQIYNNGKLVSKNLYRRLNNFKDGYMVLIKLVEDYYTDSITKDHKKKKHLKSIECIIDENGIEKFENNNPIQYIYHLGGVVCVLNKRYYNIDNRLLYCEGRDYFKTENYIFIDNKYDKDKSKRGVWKIDIFTGKYEIFR